MSTLALSPVQLYAQVPAAVAASNHASGGQDLAGALRLYAPQEERAPYRGVRVERDVRYGPGANQRLDLFLPLPDPANRSSPAAPRAALVFAAPEAGAIESLGSARRAYDNVALWAARQGLIGVTMHRRDDASAWPTAPRDFAAAIALIQNRVRQSGGDPQRLILMGAGLGGAQLLSYLAHREQWCCQGPGVAAAVLLGAPLNLAPLVPPANAAAVHTRAGMPATLLEPAHSDLPGLDGIYLPVFIGVPQYQDAMAQRSATLLQQELCRRGRCPTVRYFPGHSAITAALSIGTMDQSVSRQLQVWMTQQHR